MSESHSPPPSDDPRARLTAVIAHAAHLLPAQGPITVFIHHNTLHAFEHLPFDEALRRGAEAFGCQPYLTEGRYRAELTRGRIAAEDVREVLLAEYGARDGAEWRTTMLVTPLWEGPTAEIEYILAEADAFNRFRADVPASTRLRMIADTRRWALRDLRDSTTAWVTELMRKFRAGRIETWPDETWEGFTLQALWQVCGAGVRDVPPPPSAPTMPARHRDALVASGRDDPDLPVNEFLVRFTAAFLDQGLAHWRLPRREAGYFRSFLDLYADGGGPPDEWLSGLRKEAARLRAAGMSVTDSVLESLTLLGVTEGEWDGFLSATLLSLRGWGGMVNQVELRGDRVPHKAPAGSLVEFVAVRLILDRLAAEYVGGGRPLREMRTTVETGSTPNEVVIRRTVQHFQMAQLLGWTPAELAARSPSDWAKLVGEIESFGSTERRRIFHLAYERRFRNRTLDAFAAHRRHEPAAGFRPRFQAVTCLDEREESFRRHMEEVAPDCETFGAAGFFNVAMYYRGAADPHYIPLCPIILTPERWVEERVCDTHARDHERRTKNRWVYGAASDRLQRGVRSAVVGAMVSAAVGVLASVPLVLRILFPRLAGRAGKALGSVVRTPAATELKLERQAEKAEATAEGIGYKVTEMAAIAERLLRDIGLIDGFARLVVILGHGSDSLNNPHKSAYDCGACGGSPGAPNGRVLARFLNDGRVRALIAANGILIPADTWFLGGYHNTCDDRVSIADSAAVPDTHKEDLRALEANLAETCDRNAHERCRRFMSARLDQTPAEARIHVERRSEDLAQVRPELGHVTNAICYVGRRARTRGLFLDRRAFLTSYDPTQDDETGFTLGRLLGAAVPVCGGINLEYYFSHVDSQGYGCGTKLPHNVSGLIGVMDGAASDLRTGLPWQMVEIHEAIRLLFVIETTPEVLTRVMDRIPGVGSMIRNGWVQVSLLDPRSQRLLRFDGGAFVPYHPTTDRLPVARSSADWYRGWRDHLDFAVIAPSEGAH